MKLFGKKKEEKGPQVEETMHEIFGGFMVTKKPEGYEIVWRSPNLTSITVSSQPVIEETVQVKQEGNKIQGLTNGCKLKITKKEGKTEAHISVI